MRDDLLTLPEVAARLSCSVATVKRRIRSGDLPVYRDGRLVRVRASDVESYVAARVTRRAEAGSSRTLAGVALGPRERLWD